MTMTICNHDWLQAVDDHSQTTSEHLLAAYELSGVNTSLTDEQLDGATFWLQLLGFLHPVRVSTDGRSYVYEISVPAGG